MSLTSKNISEIILTRIDNKRTEYPDLSTITNVLVKKYYNVDTFALFSYDPNSMPFYIPAFGNVFIEKIQEDINNLPSFLPYMFNIALVDGKYREYIDYLIPILMNNIPLVSTTKMYKLTRDNSFVLLTLIIDESKFGFIYAYSNTYFYLIKDIPYSYPFTNNIDFIYFQYELLKEVKILEKYDFIKTEDITEVNRVEEIKKYTISFENKYLIRVYLKDKYAYVYDPNDIILLIIRMKKMPENIEVESTYWIDTLSYGFKYVVYPEEIQIDIINQLCRIISNATIEGEIIYNNITNREYLSPNMLVPTSIPGTFNLITKYTKRIETS